MEITQVQDQCRHSACGGDHKHFNLSCSPGEETSQMLRSARSVACERENVEASRPTRVCVEATGDAGLDNSVGVDPGPDLRGDNVGISVRNCASASLHSAAETTSVSTRVRPACEELARRRVQRQCWAEALHKKGGRQVSIFPGEDAGAEQEPTTFAAVGGNRKELKRVLRCALTITSSPSAAREPTHGLSQCKWLKSFLNVFLPPKLRANACSAEKEVSSVCGIRYTEAFQHLFQQNPVCIPPGTETLPHSTTYNLTLNPYSPQQSAESARSLEQVASPQSYVSPRDRASSRKTCALSERAGRCENFSSSPCHQSSMACSWTIPQPDDRFDQQCSQRDVTQTAEACAAFAEAPREVETVGKVSERTGILRGPDTGRPAQNPETRGKRPHTDGVGAPDADIFVRAPERGETATEVAARTASETYLFPKTARTLREGVVTTGEFCEPIFEVTRTRHPGAAAGDFVSSDGRSGAVSPVTNRRRGNRQHGAAIDATKDISKQLAEDTRRVFESGVIWTTERRTGMEKSACRSRAVQEGCTAPPVCAPSGDAVVLYERRRVRPVRDDAPTETFLLRDFEEASKACSVDSDSTTGGFAQKGDNNSVSACSSPVPAFPPHTPLPASACPAFVSTHSSPKEDSLHTEPSWPAPFHRGEEPCSFLGGGDCFQTAATSAQTRTDAATSAGKTAPTNMGAIPASPSTSVDDPRTATPSASSYCTGAATLSRRGDPPRIDVLPTAFQADDMCITPPIGTLHALDVTSLLLHAYPFPSALSRNPSSLEEVVAERNMTGDQDLRLRRLDTAEGHGTAFGVPGGVEGGEAVCGVEGDCRQVATAQSASGHEPVATVSQKVYESGGVATVPSQGDTRLKGGVSAPLLPCFPSSDVLALGNQQAERVPSIRATSRSTVERACMSEKTITSDFTCNSSAKESEKRECRDNLCIAGRARHWRSPGKSARRRSSTRVINRRIPERERGDFASLKLVSIVRSFQKDRRGEWLADRQQRQPDVRGGSIFLSTRQDGEAAASRLGNFAEQGPTSGSEGLSSSRSKEHRSICRNSNCRCIRCERAGEFHRLYISRSCHNKKKGDVEDAIVASETASIAQHTPQKKGEEMGRLRTFGPFRRHMSATETTTTPPPAAALSTVAAPPDAGGLLPSPATDTSRGPSETAVPSAAETDDVLVATNGVLATATHAEQPGGRATTKAVQGAVAAGVYGGVGVAEVNSRRREGVHCSLLPWRSTIPRLKENVADTGQQRRPSQQQQKETPRGRPHVWNGDSFGVKEFSEEVSATSCKLRTDSESRIMPFPSCSISSSTEIAKHTEEENFKGGAALHVFPSTPTAKKCASAVVRPPTVGIVSCEESTGPRTAVASVTPAAFAKPCVDVGAAGIHNDDESMFRTNCNVSTGSRDTGPLILTPIFLAERLPRSNGVRDGVSAPSRRREKRVRSNVRRMASSPPVLMGWSPVELCSVHPRASWAPVLGGSPHLKVASSLARGGPFQLQTDSTQAPKCKHHSLQATCAAFSPDRSSSLCSGKCSHSSLSKRLSTLFLPHCRCSLYHELCNTLSKQQPQRRGRQSGRSLHALPQQACTRLTPEAARRMVDFPLHCVQQEQVSQEQQLQVQQVQAYQHQQGAILYRAVQEGPCPYEENRKSASMLFQCRRAAEATGAGSQRARSLDAKYLQEKHRNRRNRRRRGIADALPCSSESETTRCATSCGEGEAEETAGQLVCAGAAAGKSCFVSDACAGGGTDSQVRRTWQRRCPHSHCSRPGKDGRKPRDSESICSWCIPAADARSPRRCHSFPIDVNPCAAVFRVDTGALHSRTDNGTPLSPTGENAQQTNSVDATFGTNHSSFYRCPILTTTSRGHIFSSGVSDSRGSAGDEKRSRVGGTSQQAVQQSIGDQRFDITGRESLSLNFTDEGSTAVARGAHEEVFQAQQGHDAVVHSPASSTCSVVFTVEECACDSLDDEDTLPSFEVLPLQHHRLSQRVQQYLQHHQRQHCSAAAAANECNSGAFHDSAVAHELLEQEYGESTLGANVPTLLDCCQALEGCWEESADEVNVYVPPPFHSLSQSSVRSLLFNAAELPADHLGRFRTHVNAVEGAALPASATAAAAAQGGTPGVVVGDFLRTAGAARDAAADAAVKEVRSSRGVAAAGDVAGDGVACTGRATGSVVEQDTTVTPATKIRSSVSPACLRVHAKHHVEAISGCDCRVRGGSLSSSTTSTGSSTSRGRAGDVDDGEKDGSEREGEVKFEPTHVTELFSGGVDIKRVNCADGVESRPPPLQPGAQVSVNAVEKSEEDTAALCDVEHGPVVTSSLVLPFSRARCAPVDAICSNKRPALDGQTVVSLGDLCSVVAKKDDVTCDPLVGPCVARTGSAGGVKQREREFLEKRLYLQVEQEQDDEQLQTEQLEQQHECDSCQQEAEQQSPQQQREKEQREKEQREKAQAHQQHMGDASLMLHLPHGGIDGVVALGECSGNNRASKECSTRRLCCLQGRLHSCTAAAAAETPDRREAASFTGDEENETAGSRAHCSAGFVKVQGQMRNTEVSEAADIHRKQQEQIPASEVEKLCTCDKEEGSTVYSQQRKRTDNDTSSPGLETAERGRLETNHNGTVILQVKFSSVLLLLCDRNAALQADLPYFEGPLSLSVRRSASSGLRRQTSSYPRLLKSVQRAAAHVERLYYFVLSRGHLFWFTERSDFSSRGFDACVGSVSLLLNACRVRLDSQTQQHQQKRVLRGSSSISSSNITNSKCYRATVHSTASLEGREWTVDRFVLQFFTDAGAWIGVNKRVSVEGNRKCGPGMRRSSSRQSVGGEDTAENTDAECPILGELELHVASGAVFCPTAATLLVKYGEATCGNGALLAGSGGDSSRGGAITSEAPSVCVTEKICGTGSPAAACASVAHASGPACERNIRDSPLCASGSTAVFSPAATTASSGNVPSCMDEQKGRRRTSMNTAAAAAAAPSWFGRLGAARSGRRSAEKKAALASYATAWVQHLQNTILQEAEEVVRRILQGATQAEWYSGTSAWPPQGDQLLEVPSNFVGTT